MKAFKKTFLSAAVAAAFSASSVMAFAMREPIVVNDAGDGADADISDSVCEATDGLGDCTLRAAIQEATAQESRIEFNIPGAGPHVIAQTSNLPEVNGIRIDATTQPGFSGKPLIVLDGRQYASLVEYGLKLTGRATVRGFVIQGFQNYGVFITEGSNTVQGCFIGTDADGLTAVGNGYGINIQDGGVENLIGGSIEGSGNVISGNRNVGVSLGLSAKNHVQGNRIGTNGELMGGGGGLSFAGLNNTVGGDDPAEANLIVGNTGFGVSGAGAQFNSIRGNVIASNTEEGIVLTGDAYSNEISHNSIYGNGDLGIDLNADGVTSNDAGDADIGPNNLQNFPVIDAAVSNGCDGAVITGVLPVRADAVIYPFRLEFFKNEAPDASGYGEGRTFLGEVVVNPDVDGNAFFSLSVPDASLGDSISATATDLYWDTSEFSAAVEVTRNDDPGTVAFVKDSASVSESSGTVEIEIRRSCGSAGMVSVDAATSDGSAVADSDYSSVSRTVSFADGETSKIVSIPVLDDAVEEGDETLTLSLSNPIRAVLVPLASVLVTITDDDGPIGSTAGSPAGGSTGSSGKPTTESAGGCALMSF